VLYYVWKGILHLKNEKEERNETMTSSANDDNSNKSSTGSTCNYIDEHLPPSIIKRLESGAFQSLCTHLRERSDQVPNLDLMTLSGFCRNCLAKWLVLEARKLSDSIQEKKANRNNNNDDPENMDEIVKSLDAMGYDEAAQYVYGMTYPEWKKRHAQKASEEKMEKFNNSKPLWATHDKQLLTKRTDEIPPVTPLLQKQTQRNNNNICNRNNNETINTAASLLSNVCCEDINNPNNISSSQQSSTKQQNNNGINDASISLIKLPGSFVPPIPPSVTFSLGVVTISDRAFAGDYEMGDLSGPAVVDTIQSILNSYSDKIVVRIKSIETAIVPDEIEIIQNKLISWSSPAMSDDNSADDIITDLIVTTGGTGFSPRDVTPEATTAVVERLCDGLMSFCALQCVAQQIQPLASLSRGTAGVRGRTLIVNLPGNPYAIKEILPILLPLALHAVADMKKMTA